LEPGLEQERHRRRRLHQAFFCFRNAGVFAEVLMLMLAMLVPRLGLMLEPGQEQARLRRLQPLFQLPYEMILAMLVPRLGLMLELEQEQARLRPLFQLPYEMMFATATMVGLGRRQHWQAFSWTMFATMEQRQGL
jgi:hypothetical protein